jgi:hypothetical protein
MTCSPLLIEFLCTLPWSYRNLRWPHSLDSIAQVRTTLRLALVDFSALVKSVRSSDQHIRVKLAGYRRRRMCDSSEDFYWLSSTHNEGKRVGVHDMDWINNKSIEQWAPSDTRIENTGKKKEGYRVQEQDAIRAVVNALTGIYKGAG